MDESRRHVKLSSVALTLVLCAVAVFSYQNVPGPDTTARARIEQARTSIVTVEIVDQSNQTISRAHGFYIRKDLVATDGEVPDKNSHVRLITAADKAMTIVLSTGQYFLPYMLVEPQAEFPPLKLADSERVALNDPVYIVDDAGKIVAGKVTGFGTLQHNRTFVLNIPVESSLKGAPIFNRDGEVIGMVTKDPNGASAASAWPSQILEMMTHLNEPG